MLGGGHDEVLLTSSGYWLQEQCKMRSALASQVLLLHKCPFASTRKRPSIDTICVGWSRIDQFLTSGGENSLRLCGKELSMAPIAFWPPFSRWCQTGSKPGASFDCCNVVRVNLLFFQWFCFLTSFLTSFLAMVSDGVKAWRVL